MNHSGTNRVWELKNIEKFNYSSPAIRLVHLTYVTGGSLDRLTIDGITSFNCQGRQGC